jgi:topoisomerase-4 subunit B
MFQENLMSDENTIQEEQVQYTDDNIRHLSDMEHVRTRPGMYIGRLGDGSLPEDGIYVLLKEVIDNSIDEFKMKAGDRLEITIDDNLRVSVRDYGRGIPQGKLIEAIIFGKVLHRERSTQVQGTIGLCHCLATDNHHGDQSENSC